MAASKRGAVYWATLAFGGLFIGGTMGGELIYYKYFKKERDEEIAQVSVKFVSLFRSYLVCLPGSRRRDKAAKVCPD